MLVTSINNYGIKMASQDRPHKKPCRISEFNQINSEELYKFLAICLLSGSIKFSVIRNMFSNNP